MSSIDHSGDRPRPRASSQPACLACRRSKLKCKVNSPNEKCERCEMKASDCVFVQHRRGGKSGARIRKNIERPEAPGNLTTPNNHEKLSSPPTGSFGSEGLQQVGILSREAQFGKFSLENILSIPDILRPQARQDSRPYTMQTDNYNDPITCNMLSFPIALGLFDSFMRCLNPYISQLDPKLHTFDYVRQRSSFLLTAILSASSKAFQPALHPTLRSHTENLLGKAFTQGKKSTETVQAILIFTYWKEPDEIRTWLLVGYAIRMCIELGWHELQPAVRKAESPNDEMEIREVRNIERTWLVLFVYDRSLSLQLGKPWMIEQNDLVRKSKDWYKEEYAVPGGDILLSAFVCLRLVSSEMLELGSPSKQEPRSSRVDLLSRLLNSDISAWEKDWLSLFEHESVAPSQRFLVHYYGLHLRLLLNSYALQNSLMNVKNGIPVSKSALWLSSSSAIGMLEQISQELGPLKQLYFLQDSVHVMTAYAAIFLVKLVVSLPKNLCLDLEAHSTRAILQAADTFAQQCATQMTGCALQARFLRNLVEKYQNLKTTINKDKRRVVSGAISQSRQSNQTNQANQTNHPINTGTTSMPQALPSCVPEDLAGDFASNSSMAGSQADFDAAHLLNDKDMWEGLLADAGFWMPVSEGIFLSDNMNGNLL